MGLAQCLAAAFLFLLILAILFGLTPAQRVVTVQQGPLHRVRGSHVTLWCKVSGYQGPAEQNFQWSIYLPSAPEREVQIVSTVDPSFPYAIYTQRVRGRGIYVERVQGDAVLLHITELQDRDAGEYECHTPNTDERYFGSYSAKMNLSVIADTLSASMAPQVLTLTEGDVVELTCEVSKSTTQHTHLSVGWYHLRGAGEHQAEEVLTLSKDFILKPGPSYVQRFLVGDVRLNKVGNTTYKLFLGGVKPSDQGQLYCEAAEWIEDPDKTWKDISRKQTERTSLTVMSQGRDLSVDIAAAENSLSEGDTLQLNCMVEAQKSDSRHFQVIWLLNNMEVARVDPHGVLTWEEEYEERAKLGQLRALKPSNTIYALTIYEVGLRDNGTYRCSVSEMKTPGDLHGIQTNLSSGIQVNVKPIGLGLRATLTSRIATVRYGQSFELVCQVSANYPLEEVPASVRWLFQPNPPTSPYHELVQVFPNGTVAWVAAQSRFKEKAQLMKADTSFRLHIHSAVAADEGTYQCEVEVWRRNVLPLGQPAATTSSNPVGIKVVLPESKLRVSTEDSSVEVASSADTAVECRIVFAQNNSQLAVTWYLLPPLADGTPLQIIRANYGGVLEYGPEFSSPAQKSRFLSQRVSSNVFWLQILSANLGDRGRYYCVVEEWLWLVDGWYKLGEGTSGRTTLEFKLPERELQADKTNHSLSAREGEEVTLPCLLQGARLPGTHLSATWFQVKKSGLDSPLLALHHDGTIQLPQEGQARRLYLRRPAPGDFSLTLTRVESSDAGLYCCQVQEWQQQGEGQDWTLQASARSGYTQLSTIPPESTVMSRICSSPSLLNFILCLPLVLILLLALAVSCWYCKYRKGKKGNITGNQLMELDGNGEVKTT
ncbi:PREDICTED: immunoglobulin superfamily member 3-like [Lepidothrix coronata]|uniref:immunoglobulin superfamily member 3-like n=1 Tax=Lepidothrix coronata TaxID=321398 RepID=UPI000819AE0B|nr:PREDICTED: immunoglobulin superfamily member 3-like [Lepidothrix coronata]